MGLAPVDIVATWEQGAGRRAHERAVILLDAVMPGSSVDDVLDLAIGARDAALLDVHRALVGGRVEGTSGCESCGETLEVVFEVDDVTVDAESMPGEQTIQCAGYEVTFHLPNGRDLALAEAASDVAGARAVLLARCLTSARFDGVPVSIGDLPEHVIDAVDDAMAAADPQGDLEIATSCPACAAPQRLLFDPITFVWSELEERARRVLRDVHELASAYGWREDEVMALPEARRSLYLELVTG
jgi:hypothetical protein